MLVGAEIGVGQMSADVDVVEGREIAMCCNPPKELRDLLGVLMIGCHAVADQSEGNGQPFEHRHLDASCAVGQ